MRCYLEVGGHRRGGRGESLVPHLMFDFSQNQSHCKLDCHTMCVDAVITVATQKCMRVVFCVAMTITVTGRRVLMMLAVLPHHACCVYAQKCLTSVSTMPLDEVCIFKPTTAYSNNHIINIVRKQMPCVLVAKMALIWRRLPGWGWGC